MACFTRGLLFVNTPDSHLDAIRAVALPAAHDAVRHTLIDRATRAHPLPKTESGLADLHRRKLAALVMRRPVRASLPGDGKPHGKGDHKREVGAEDEALGPAREGLAANLRAHVKDMNDAVATGLHALTEPGQAAGEPPPKESKTSSGAS